MNQKVPPEAVIHSLCNHIIHVDQSSDMEDRNTYKKKIVYNNVHSLFTVLCLHNYKYVPRCTVTYFTIK